MIEIIEQTVYIVKKDGVTICATENKKVADEISLVYFSALKVPKAKIQLESIIEKIKKITGINLLNNKSSVSQVVDARKIYCHIARKNGYIVRVIAEKIDFSKSNVIHLIGKCEDMIFTDLKFRNTYNKIIKEL